MMTVAWLCYWPSWKRDNEVYVNYNKVTMWTRDMIMQRMIEDPKWREQALLTLLQRQTDLEKEAKDTLRIKNAEGFQRADAYWFTIFAQRVQKRATENVPAGQRLTETETNYVMRPWKRGKRTIPAICKYRGQILDMIESKAREAMQRAQ